MRNKKRGNASARLSYARDQIIFPVPCYYCQNPIKTKEEHTWDHKQPKSKGGTSEKHNLAHCCKKCNKEKADLTEEQFLTRKGLFLPIYDLIETFCMYCKKRKTSCQDCETV